MGGKARRSEVQKVKSQPGINKTVSKAKLTKKKNKKRRKRRR